MKKFVIEKTKGNTDTVVKTFDTKEEALAFGEELIKNMIRSEGILTCAYTDVDEVGNKTSDSEEIYHVWY